MEVHSVVATKVAEDAGGAADPWWWNKPPLSTGELAVSCTEDEIKAALPSTLLLREGSLKFCRHLDSFVEINQLIEGVAAETLQKESIMQYENITPPEPPVQEFVPVGEILPKQLDALYARAPEGEKKFHAFCRGLVGDIGLDPDKVMLEQARGKDNMIWSVYTKAPLKGRQRAVEKGRDNYEKNGRQLVDIVRGAIVVDTEDDLEAVMKCLIEHYVTTEREGVQVISFKNRFRHPMADGGRDMNFNISVTLDDGSRFVCELQVHLQQILDYKEAAHELYEFFRSYFKGGDAVSQRGELLARIAKNRDVSDIARILKEALDGTDEDKLDALAELFRKLNVFNVVTAI